MLDLKFILENTDFVKEQLAKRNGSYKIDELVALAKRRLELLSITEKLKAEKNSVSKEVGLLKQQKQNADAIIAKMQELSTKIKEDEAILVETEEKIKEMLLATPNIPNIDLPVGKDSDDNVEVRHFSKPTEFSFTAKAHWDIGEALDIFDWPRAAKITGARFTVYKGLGAKLERAVINFMLDLHYEHGYQEIFPPFMVNKDSMIGTGQLPKFVEDMYSVSNTDYFLIPTAEVPVTNLHRNEIIPSTQLPISYCAYTACFRGEAGSAGRDTRGLIRQHQFNKVELVKFTKPNESYAQLEKLTSDAEDVLKKLNLPYRVVTLCTGDIGFSSAKTYDIEVWMPSYNRYVEISSCSNFEDYQARRANIRFKDGDNKPQLVHTLNGSGLAVGRTVAAILENYQNEDGSVNVPEALQKYLNGIKIIK